MKIATYKYNWIPDIEHIVNVNSIGKIRTVFLLLLLLSLLKAVWLMGELSSRGQIC